MLLCVTSGAADCAVPSLCLPPKPQPVTLLTRCSEPPPSRCALNFRRCRPRNWTRKLKRDVKSHIKAKAFFFLIYPHTCPCERTQGGFFFFFFAVWGADKALSLSFGIHYGPGLLSESLYSLREVPICGSMWQRGSKSPLMNQYVGGLSLWRGRPRTANSASGQKKCMHM